MVKSDAWQRLPASKELPCSDNTLVDNEDQSSSQFFIFLLEFIWKNYIDGMLSKPTLLPSRLKVRWFLASLAPKQHDTV